ncbi:hypothetical protein [Brevundimonas sp. Root1279]|uniref:hypothetical protein n=1 Tax=Brevundimonas sp. Root1279 TaxID=1736443 RepID=UPI0012E33BCB|nr:hypothetical protein [Brevundimonas sp. Root1279]
MHDRVKRHQKASLRTAPGKAFQPARAFCPAAVAGRPDKSLIFREFAFCAWVMPGKERKHRAIWIGPPGRRPAPGKKRPHAASFDISGA